MIRKNEIIDHIRKKFNLNRIESRDIVNEIFDYMKEWLKKWEEISIFEFFKMGIKDAMSRTTQHPKSKKVVQEKLYKKVYCHFTVRFRSVIKDLYK